ncbi:MAG: DUF1553 domain-containing protein [Rubripirellula sp.]|nr:DUF1553 domain-containing protein [Rubripirellula sp.]
MPRLPLLLFLLLPAPAMLAEETLRFNRDIRPILSENCFHCHGPDESGRESDLRLDTEESAKELAIDPSSSEQSEMVHRMVTDDPDALMPPPDSGKSLTDEQIETIRRWIDQGAPYEEHWSFIPAVRSAVPQTKSDSRHPVDRFIAATLETKGLTAAPRANRETLIRRVTFDLIGLPPTIDEIDQFLADESPDAYPRLVDRLLSRPEFGERMAANWLDAARYSDTYGYQVDRDRFVWPWRDWVINAFNENRPYDQFITEQLAGDLLPDATREQTLATTFNRLHPQKVEGGSTPEEFRIEYVADRTQTVATAMLGLTFECCRCHSHKYDPFSQQEYYQLSAFFDNIDEAGLYSYFTPSVPTPTLTLPTAAQQSATENHEQTVAQLERGLPNLLSERTADARDFLESVQTGLPDDFWASPVKALDFEESPPGGNQLVEGIDGKAFQLTGDDAVGAGVGNFPRWQPFSVSLWIRTPDHKQRAVIFHRSRAWTDAGSRGYQLLIEEGKLSWSLIHFWPGNAMRIRMNETIPIDTWVHVTVTNDGSSRAGGLKIYLDGELAKTEIVRDRLTKQITGGGGNNIAIGERFRDRGFKGGSIDRMRIFDVELTALEAEQVAHLETITTNTEPRANNTDTPDRTWQQQWEAAPTTWIDHALQRHDPAVIEQKNRLAEARKASCQAQDSLQEIMVMREREQPRTTYLLVRGAYDNRGERVEAMTPKSLTPFDNELPQNRLGFARWLCDPEHPLTSRVAVNRLWQLCFGSGLVRTPEDFGSQGAPPTHPELLDWLAVEFVESNWDVKRMLRTLLTSETYCRESHATETQIESVDPDNRWLARHPSYRLPAEMLRDNALALSGRLVLKRGGPPVKPYELEASFKPSKPDVGEGLYRRSLYTYWKRTGPAPAMMTFDAAKRDVCRVQREKTSSPLQALVLLNGPQYVEAARGVAESLSRRHGITGVRDSIEIAFRMMTSRTADTTEIDVLVSLYQNQHSYFTEKPERVSAFLGIGRAAPLPDLDRNHVAALTVVMGALLNYDQSMMKR